MYHQEKLEVTGNIHYSRTSIANFIIIGAEWFIPVINMLWKYAYLEPVLNADETPTRVLKKNVNPPKEKVPILIVYTDASASKKIALYTY